MPHTASKIINTCVLLHNMILNDGVDETIHPNIIYDGIFEDQPYFDDDNNTAGKTARNNFIFRYFS